MSDKTELFINLRTGTDPTGETEITENGTHDVKDYATAVVDVQPDLQTKEVTPTEEVQTVEPDAGKDGLSSVMVNPIPDEYIVPAGTAEITENGTYNVREKVSAVVDVVPDLQTKQVTPTKQTQTVEPDTGKDGLSSVMVNPIPDEYIVPAGTAEITENGTFNIKEKATAVVDVQPDLQAKQVTPTKQTQTVEPDSGKDGLSSVTVNPIPDEYIVPTGAAEITENGTFNIKEKATAVVDVQPDLQAKQVTPTKQTQTVEPDSGKDGLSSVTVNPIPDEYIVPTGAAEITENGTYDIKDKASAVVNVPQVTPTGSVTITDNGTYDVADKAEAVVNVPGPQAVLTGTDGPTTLTVSNLSSIRMYGLYGQSTIKELHLPDTNSIWAYALNGMSALNTLDIPKATTLGAYALANNDALRSLNAPIVKTITNDVFEACSAINVIDLPSLTKITNPKNAFNNCYNMLKLRMPKLEQTGSSQSDAFRLCDKLESVDVGYMQIINAASGTASLSGLDVPRALKLIALRHASVVTLSAQFNANSPLKKGTGFVLVPRANISSYQAATNWSTLYTAGTQFLAIEDYTTDGTIEGVLDEDKIDALLA